MKKFAYTIIVVLVMLSCNNDNGIFIPIGSEEIDLTINFVGLNLQTSGLSGKSAKNNTSQKISDWVHIFEAGLSIKFTNKETLKVYSLAYNPATPSAGYKIILPFGVYDYKLESLGDAYSDYIPFKAEGIIEINQNVATLNLVGVTQYGLVTVDKFHITSAVLQDTQLGLIQMPSSQEHFYKYVLSQKAPLVKITEDLLNTQPTYQLPSIVALVRYNLMLGVNELSVISFILSDFQQEDFYVGIDQNAARTYVPDDNFEKALINLGYDDVLDDYVLTNNIKNITKLSPNTCGFPIINITGIEDFTALTSLSLICNKLINLDLSSNTALTELYLWNNEITNIDLSENIALTELFLHFNQLTSIDVSANKALTKLYLDNNQLTSLDLSANKYLTRLEVANNQLTSLDLSDNTVLKTLRLRYNQLTSLDLSLNTALIELELHNNQLTSIDVSNNKSIERLWIGNNQLTSMDVSANTALTYLDVSYNQLTSLNVSTNTALIGLFLFYNQLTSIDVSANTVLARLELHNNQLTSLDVSANKAITYLYARENPNLSCIQVNQTQLNAIPTNWLKDAAAGYSLNCN